MRRLGKNKDGYFGETIDIRVVLREVKKAAQQSGWCRELFYKTGDLELFALHHKPLSPEGAGPVTRAYISTGIHGDEPAGPLAALRLVQEKHWPANLELWLLPCLNPTGFILNSRENDGLKDLNRDYRHLETGEVDAHTRWLECQPNFDVTLCLHEDWESHGFYVYELNPDHRPSLAGIMLEAVVPICPTDLSPVIEGREARNGVISPNLDPTCRPQWPEAFWLLQHKTRQCYTLEAPSDFPMETRVNALVAAVKASLDGLNRGI